MLTMDNIVRDGHPALRKVAEEVAMPPSKEDIKTLEQMHAFLVHSQDPDISEEYELRAGVGLAAPQINISKRMIVVLTEDENDKTHSYRLFNPKIISHSVELSYLTNGEGCLSVDESIPGYVPRYARVTVRAFNESGEPVRLRLKGFLAIVFQHEIDHLNGIMFYDHINKADPFQEIPNAIPIES